MYTKLKSGAANVQQQQQPTYDGYGAPLQQPQQHDYNAARTRKLYFTGLVVLVQILITWWLSRNLVPPSNRATLTAGLAGTQVL